jgi:hypothetical protein
MVVCVCVCVVAMSADGNSAFYPGLSRGGGISIPRSCCIGKESDECASLSGLLVLALHPPNPIPSGKGTQEKGVPAMQVSPPRCRAVVGRQLFSDTPAAGSPVLGVHSTTLGPAKIILEGSGGQQRDELRD